LVLNIKNGLSRKEAYNELLRISDKLYHRDLKIKNKNGSITKTRWISSITYNPDDAVISIEFAETEIFISLIS
jgi:plasmid replication initiation protein